MHISPVNKDTSAVSHAGERFEPDEHGRFDVPQDLAERLLQGPGWHVSEEIIEADAPEAPAKKPRTRAPKAE